MKKNAYYSFRVVKHKQNERHKMKQLNELFKLCIRQKITVSELSRLTDLERTRVHRLVHSDCLEYILTVGEFKRILKAFPNESFDFFN